MTTNTYTAPRGFLIDEVILACVHCTRRVKWGEEHAHKMEHAIEESQKRNRADRERQYDLRNTPRGRRI